MKTYFSLALLSALSVFSASAQVQQVKETTSDVAIEAPPAGVGPVNQLAPSSKPKRQKSTSAQSQPAARHAIGSEVKGFSFNRTFTADRLARPLIIRSGKVDPKTFSQLQEDLAIMSRIVEKSAADYRDDREEVAGIPILALNNGKAVRALYLEDYGILFTLTVNMPLQPEPRMEQVEEKPQAVNEEWNEARNELFGERRTHAVRADRAPRREFDQHQLDEFRDSLTEALRNAGNIRNLRENDWITIVVRGLGSALEVEAPLDLLVRSGYGGAFNAQPRETFSPNATISVSTQDRTPDGSTMVLRVKKGALDEFARTKGSPEEFRKKVTVVLY
jgi:hypothetical protein